MKFLHSFWISFIDWSSNWNFILAVLNVYLCHITLGYIWFFTVFNDKHYTSASEKAVHTKQMKWQTSTWKSTCLFLPVDSGLTQTTSSKSEMWPYFGLGMVRTIICSVILYKTFSGPLGSFETMALAWVLWLRVAIMSPNPVFLIEQQLIADSCNVKHSLS